MSLVHSVILPVSIIDTVILDMVHHYAIHEIEVVSAQINRVQYILFSERWKQNPKIRVVVPLTNIFRPNTH